MQTGYICFMVNSFAQEITHVPHKLVKIILRISSGPPQLLLDTGNATGPIIATKLAPTQCCQIKFLNIHENFSEMFTKSSRIKN